MFFYIFMLMGFGSHSSTATMREAPHGANPTAQSSWNEGGPGAGTTARRIIGASKQVYRILVQIDGAIKSGTGFLVSGKRIVATNSHVLTHGTAYALGYVNEQGRTEWVKLEVLAIYPQKDLALLQAHADLPGEPFALPPTFPS